MNLETDILAGQPFDATETSPILIVPYMWIGDFVRIHSVVRVLKARWPNRPVDMLSTAMVSPLVDYMPGVRKAIIWNLPRKRLALGQHRQLAARLAQEGYAQALVMPRTWKAALAPCLAGIATRTGFVGEWRFGILNDVRRGEKALPRMIDQCAALALPPDAVLPQDWPVPILAASPDEVARWRAANDLPADGRPVAVLAPGAVGPSKRWPAASYGEAARRMADRGHAVWIVGGPGEKPLVAEIVAAAGDAGPAIRDLTGADLRNAILALAAANVAVSNDSGLLHVAAALGTPSVGIFGPTSAWHWAPLNKLAATIETQTVVECRPCHKPVCRYGHHRCMREIPVERVAAEAMAAIERAP